MSFRRFPCVAINGPGYFDGRMRDVTVRRSPNESAWPAPSQPRIISLPSWAVKPRRTSSRRGGNGRGAHPERGHARRRQATPYDDPVSAMDGALNASGSVPIEYAFFGQSPYWISVALSKRKRRKLCRPPH